MADLQQQATSSLEKRGDSSNSLYLYLYLSLSLSLRDLVFASASNSKQTGELFSYDAAKVKGVCTMATEMASYSLAYFILLLKEEDDDGVFFALCDGSKAN